MKFKLIAVLSVALVCSPAFAKVYKWKDSKGITHFSDRPHAQAQEVKLPKVQTYKAPKPTAHDHSAHNANVMPQANKLDSAPVRSYENISISTPQKDATIRNNNGHVPVSISVKPALTDNDKLQLLLDGKPLGPAQTATSFGLTNIKRGTHQLAVAVVDANNNTLNTSQPVTFHMHRPRINQIRPLKQP